MGILSPLDVPLGPGGKLLALVKLCPHPWRLRFNCPHPCLSPSIHGRASGWGPVGQLPFLWSTLSSVEGEFPTTQGPEALLRLTQTLHLLPICYGFHLDVPKASCTCKQGFWNVIGLRGHYSCQVDTCM